MWVREVFSANDIIADAILFDVKLRVQVTHSDIFTFQCPASEILHTLELEVQIWYLIKASTLCLSVDKFYFRVRRYADAN